MKVLHFPTRGRPHEPGWGWVTRPGSAGEHMLQEWHGTEERAARFYATQLSDELTPAMAGFIRRMEMAFIATCDATGECDCSFRAGPPGFLRVIDQRTIAYPEFRGNGVMASLGNIVENPHVGMFLVDFTRDLIGLHVNGLAQIITPAHMAELDPGMGEEEVTNAGRRPLQWVLVRVAEAYIHCSKHIPLLVPQSRVRHWGTDNPRHKGGDYFGAVARNTGAAQPAAQQVPTHPVPTQPVPTQPVPGQPVPTPTQPAPMRPVPAEPAPAEPAVPAAAVAAAADG